MADFSRTSTASPVTALHTIDVPRTNPAGVLPPCSSAGPLGSDSFDTRRSSALRPAERGADWRCHCRRCQKSDILRSCSVPSLSSQRFLRWAAWIWTAHPGSRRAGTAAGRSLEPTRRWMPRILIQMRRCQRPPSRTDPPARPRLAWFRMPLALGMRWTPRPRMEERRRTRLWIARDPSTPSGTAWASPTVALTQGARWTFVLPWTRWQL